MNGSVATWWWVAAGVLVAAELASGTFYLLMLSVGAAAAALAAHAGFALSGQLIVAALIGGGAVAAWHLKRSHDPAPADDERGLGLDVGEHVQVAAWQPDGSATVTYRGAAWQARWAGAGAPRPGDHVIRAIDGSRLVLDRPAPRER